MILINVKCNSKSYSSATNSGQEFAKFSSEEGNNISKAKFHTPTFRHEKDYLVNLT